LKKVSVIGAGSWGTALAFVLAENGYDVFLHSHNAEIISDINERHRNFKYLKDAPLPENIRCFSDYETVLKDSRFVVFVVPSHAMREVVKKAAPFLDENALIVHASKGIEINTLKSMSEVLKEELPVSYADKIVVFSGPSHAEEVVKRMPTAITASCYNVHYAKEVQKLFMNHYLRVYTNNDVIGVELGGSLKNIIALAAGLSDGLGYGDNAKAALLTRGLSEIARLGIRLGANPMTFSGLAGIGDLIVTGTSVHSRNWKTGNLLAKGHTLDEALSSLGMVAEGVKTTKAAHLLSDKLQIELPITNQLYGILFLGKEPKEAVKELMERNMTDEFNFF